MNRTTARLGSGSVRPELYRPRDEPWSLREIGASRAPRLSRRTLLARAGASALAVVAIGGSGVAWRMVQQSVLRPGAGDAYAAWSAGLTGGGPLPLVRAAVLAANAHDSQPWFFQVSERQIDIFADRSRNLGALDPLLREMEVSLGCAIENLDIAARANGTIPVVSLLPDPAERDHVARVLLSGGPTVASPLFDAIPRRHTDRGTYDARPIDRTVLDSLIALADEPDARVLWLDSDADKSRFADLTVAATAAIIADPDQSRDDFAWYRQDWEEIQRTRDGITLDTAGLSEALRVAVRTLPPADRASLQSGWLDATRARHVAAAAFGLVLVKNRADTRERLLAGRLFQRVHLSATARGLAIQPLNQLIERADRESSSSLAPTFSRSLSTIAPQGWDPVMGFRIGHPMGPPGPAPRRLAEQVIRLV